jgi:flavin-dependent dehydrogenase
VISPLDASLGQPELAVDVAIIGGGPAGSATALSLARDGLNVALLERGDYTEWKVGESLPPACKPLLQRLGIWADLAPAGHLPSYGTRSAWGSPVLQDQSYLFDPSGYGWHLDRPLFDRRLAEAAGIAGAQVYRRTEVVAWKGLNGGAWKLLLRSDGGMPVSLSARFVIDASGRKRVFARRNGSDTIVYDRLVGVVTLLCAEAEETDRDGSTLVEAVPDGWWYATRVPDNRLVAAFLSDGDLAPLTAARTLAGWTALVHETTHLRQRLEVHGYRVQCPPKAYPANSCRLTEVTGEAWLATGDAAVAYDPLSSQGILCALLTGLRAVTAIREWLTDGSGALQRYADYVEHVYAEYRHNLAAYYAMERRWPSSTFWRRRHGTAAWGSG